VILARFVHTSDLHLGSPFSGIERSSPAVARELHEATYITLDNIVDLCIRESVDGLLIAGDVFEVRSLASQLRYQAALRRLDAEGVRSFICHGNHDALDQWEARLDLPATAHHFGPTAETVPLNPKRPDDVVVTGVSFESREIRRNLAASFVRPSSSRFGIGLLHAQLSSLAFANDRYAGCTIEDLTGLGYGYWALGHVHERKIIEQDDVTIAYSGAPQGLNRRQSGPRGVNLVSVHDDGSLSIEFVETAAVRWQHLDIDLAGLDTEQALLDSLRRSLESLRRECGERPCVYDVTLGGTTSLHTSLHREGFIDDLVSTLNQEFGRGEPWAWCASMTVNSRAPFDRAARLQGEDFVGALLRLVERTSSEPALRQSLLSSCRELLDDPGIARLLERPDEAEVEQLLRDAETLCLAGLEEGEDR
jgi:DNA repair protein SbcD/Mre11